VTSTRLASRLNNRRRNDPGHRWVRVAMAVLASIGAIDTGAITLKRWGLLAPLACPGGAEACDKVLNSPWATVFGQPLSLYGCLAYAAVVVLAVLPLLVRGESRSSLATASRWGLFLVSAGMATFSMQLLGLMAFRIHAACAFCILSACITVALLVLSLVGGDWEDRGKVIFRGVLTALAVIVIGIGWISAVDRPTTATAPGMPPPVTSVSSPAALALARHLTSSGAAIYTAYWCPHCHEQKELFGRQATAELKVIECAPDGHDNQKALCDSKKLQGFPTWEINGKLESGVKPLAKLAEMSGFKGSGF